MVTKVLFWCLLTLFVVVGSRGPVVLVSDSVAQVKGPCQKSEAEVAVLKAQLTAVRIQAKSADQLSQKLQEELDLIKRKGPYYVAVTTSARGVQSIIKERNEAVKRVAVVTETIGWAQTNNSKLTKELQDAKAEIASLKEQLSQRRDQDQ